MLVDSHCHLDYDGLAEDLDGVLGRAGAAGVGTFLTIGTRIAAFPGVRAIAERYPQVWCSIGIHPHEAANENADPAALVAAARHPKVVGIGETGLDYYYDSSPRDQQQRNFRLHLDAAQEAGLPVIVHTRDADADTAAILEETARRGPVSGVLHCFTSGRALAERAVELGFYVSMSGILTFKNAEDLRATAKALPLDRLLVETDAPYLAPVPMRGKPNEPAFVAHTAKRLAELRGIPVAELAAATTDNFFRLFAKAKRTA